MNQDKIRVKREKLENRRQKISTALRELQDECKHPNKNKVAGGRDLEGDFWAEYICPDCLHITLSWEGGFK